MKTLLTVMRVNCTAERYCNIPQWVQYKLCATVHRCLQHKAPQYVTDCCSHTSDIARRQHLPGGR